MEPETGPEQPATRAEQQAPRGELRGDRLRRHAHRTGLYTSAGALVVLLVVVIALVVANTRSVKVSWVFGPTHQSLVWIILITAILGWLLDVVTSVVFRSARGAGPKPADRTARFDGDALTRKLGS